MRRRDNMDLAVALFALAGVCALIMVGVVIYAAVSGYPWVAVGIAVALGLSLVPAASMYLRDRP